MFADSIKYLCLDCLTYSSYPSLTGEYIKKTAKLFLNYTDSGKNELPVEISLLLFLLFLLRFLFLLLFLGNKQLLQLVEVTPVEEPEALGVRGGLVKEVVI